MISKDARDRYDAVRRQWPWLFANPPEAAYTILLDPPLVDAAETAEEARLAAKGRPGSWSTTGVVFEDPYIIFVRDAVRRPDGSLGTYVRALPASGSAGAAVLPLFNGQIVLLRHFRHATRAEHLEIPRGFGEPGVSPSDQARQELREEIGAEARTLVDLGSFHSNTGAASDCVELFLAEIDALGKPQASEGISGIAVHPPHEVAEIIGVGGITDSFTIGAFTRALLRGSLPGLRVGAPGESSPPA